MASISVWVVAHKGNSALVEFVQNGYLQRRVVPYSAVNNDTLDERTLESGAPYGVSFADLDMAEVFENFPTLLGQACHERGLWTQAEFERNPTKVQEALQSIFGLSVARVLNFIALHETD